MQELQWFNCYRASWNAAPLVPEAYSHPAKVAFGLAQRIYEHMLEQGWIATGSSIVDPFGGIGGFAFHAMRYGLNWYGCELEPKFVTLAQANIDLWNGRYSPHFPKWGAARIVQGDSRQLGAILAGMDGAVSSPPFTGVISADNVTAGRKELAKELGVSVANVSPVEMEKVGKRDQSYGRTPGQLGAMPQGSHDAAIDSAVSSPPYAETIKSSEGPGARHDHIHHNGANATKNSSDPAYGTSGGQLGHMRYDAAVSSSPFEKSQSGGGIVAAFRGESDYPLTAGQGGKYQGYLSAHQGETKGQLGNDTGATFWTAAREIVQQTYNVLKPGAVAAWVTGNFRRNGEIVDFGGQWLALCEAVGFVGLEHVIAWKVERRGNQLDIFGNSHSKDISRVSFFRRLDNAKNPGQEIESEEVWFVRKPL